VAETDFVPYSQRVQYILHGVPATFQRRLQREARHRSVANVVNEILADRYRIPYEPSRRGPKGTNGSSTLMLRLPPAVHAGISGEADARSVTMRTVILDALGEAFKLKAPPPTTVGKRPGRPRKDHR
jgi:predicted HicB family RNase H-like nuclease